MTALMQIKRVLERDKFRRMPGMRRARGQYSYERNWTLMCVKVRKTFSVHQNSMNERKNLIDCLRAQAELCLKMASHCWDEERAEALRQMARECLDGARKDRETVAVARVRHGPPVR